MKRFAICSILLALSVLTMYAKKPDGSWDALQGAQHVGVVINMDDAITNGGIKFALARSNKGLSEGQWKDILYRECYAQFIHPINNEVGEVFGMQEFVEASLYIRLDVVEMDSDGEAKATLVLCTADGQELGSMELKSQGSRHGTWVNLMGDGMREMGEQAAKKLSKHI